MGAQNSNDYGVQVCPSSSFGSSAGSASSSLEAETFETPGTITDWIEMWDYLGGVRFRGFVAGKETENAMFVFFDQLVIGADLKAGLMALLELCEIDHFSCSRLVVCIDRQADQVARETLTKDLGWIGFSLTTLDDFSYGDALTSNKWLLMDMDT